MLHTFRLIALFCLLAMSSQAQYSIGSYTYTFQDSNRSNRLIETEIYYPANTSGVNTPVAQGQFPVIVFGHGFSMTWSAYENWWKALVPNGYIVVFPKTESGVFSVDHQAFGKDLLFLSEALQVEGTKTTSPLQNAVDTTTALMGHSMGGGAAFLAADEAATNSSSTVKALIGLAPAESTTNGVSSIGSATRVFIPSIIFSGSQDGVTPPTQHHLPMYDSLRSTCKTFVNIQGGAHCYFAQSNFACDFGEGTASTGIAVTRTEQQLLTKDFLTPWLDYQLKGDCIAWNRFQDSLYTSNRITYQQSCSWPPVVDIVNNAGVLTTTNQGQAWQWYLSGVAITGAINPQYIPLVSGTYEVEVTQNATCVFQSPPLNYILLNTKSLVQEKEKTLSFYPNPSRGELYLENTHLDKALIIRLYSAQGLCIQSLELAPTSKQRVHLELNPGVYYLSYHRGQGDVITSPLIIE